MMYIVIKKKYDYSSCYYEGDIPTVDLDVKLFSTMKDAQDYSKLYGGEIFARECHI